MKKRMTAMLATAGLTASFCLAASAASITASSVTGDVKAAKGGATPAAVTQGEVLRSGTVVHTGRDGRLVGSFDAENSFEVMPESVLKIKNRLGIALSLTEGRVRSNLTSWPASRSYKVKTSAGTYEVSGTAFDTAYRLGPAGEFIGGTEVTEGEVSYATPEVSIPSITAGGGVNVTRTVGAESVLLEITANGQALTVQVAGAHELTVAAGTTVRIAVTQDEQRRFMALVVTQGSANVGGQTLTPADGAVYVAGSGVLAADGAGGFMDGVQAEAGAHAQLQLPGLTPDQTAALEAQQQNGSAALQEAISDGGLGAPQFHAPFVPEQPMGVVLSPSGNP